MDTLRILTILNDKSSNSIGKGVMSILFNIFNDIESSKLYWPFSNKEISWKEYNSNTNIEEKFNDAIFLLDLCKEKYLNENNMDDSKSNTKIKKMNASLKRIKSVVDTSEYINEAINNTTNDTNTLLNNILNSDE